ncbi:MAG: hypothetical protein DRJ41_01225 [Thermoprotei archaeon]|nr:MAG: hypothetical protein DRJ41_01225 [Thermoprotei archaeon]
MSALRFNFINIARFIILIYILIFIIYPILNLFYLIVTPQSLYELLSLFQKDIFQTAFWNTVYVTFWTLVFALAIGVPFSYFLYRYRIPFKKIVLSAVFMPTMIPPFVGALSFIYLLGRFGTINLLLMDAGFIKRPINFIYGLHGVILVQTITFFPWIAINVYNSLLKLDRSLEEAAETLGARPLRRFFTVTLPSITPGLITGIFLVTSFSFTDYATPIVLGRYDLLAPQAFINILQSIDEERVRMGTYIVIILLLIVMAFFFLTKKYLSLREYASLRLPRPLEEISPTGVKKALLVTFIYVTLFLALLPHIYIFMIALSKSWSFTPFPTEWAFDNLIKIMSTRKPIMNTFLYGFIAAVTCFLVGSTAAYIIARTQHPLNSFIDSWLSIMFVVPGIVVGISYLFAFSRSTLGLALGSSWLIMPLMLATRRITYTVRYSYATYLSIRKNIEEIAYVLGERPLKVFLKIVLPNALHGIVAGTLFSLIMIFNELTASLFIYKPGWETITIQMFIEVTVGRLNLAASYAVLLFIASFIMSSILFPLSIKRE